MDMMDGECLCELLDLVVQDKHKSATHASEHVRPRTLEESFGSLILGDLLPTVDCALVHNVSFWEKKVCVRLIVKQLLFSYKKSLCQTA